MINCMNPGIKVQLKEQFKYLLNYKSVLLGSLG